MRIRRIATSRMMTRVKVKAKRRERAVNAAMANAASAKKPTTTINLGGVVVVRIGSGKM